MALAAKLAFLFGPLLLTGGILNYLLTPVFVRLISQKLLVIQPGTVFYEKWIRTPIPLRVDLYVFDIQNPRGIMRGQKPIVKEIGPFSFLETREKTILRYSPDNETVTYVETKIYKFNRAESIGDLDRHYITPNLAFLSTIKIWNMHLKNFPLSFLVQPVAERLLSSMMEFYQQNLFINVTVNDIMFKGVHVNFVPLLQTLVQTFERFGVAGEVTALSNSSFSFFKYLNGSPSGPYEVYTGAFGLSQLTQLKRFKEKEVLDTWSDPECNTIRGSDGVQFSPFRKDKSKLYVFTHELCRAVALEYKRDSDVRGIKTYRYEPVKGLFTRKSADGKCDCSDSYRCKYPGVVDLSPCWYQSPLYGSMPHFSGDEFSELRKSIIGLKPNVSRHTSFVDLDPFTGASLRGGKRGQVNTYVEKIAAVRSTRAVRDDLFLPLFWYEEFGEINEPLEKEIKMKSVYPLIVNNHITLFSLIVGSLFSVVYCVSCMCCRKRKKKVDARKQATYSDKEKKANSYEKLTNLDDAESTKTDSSASSKNTKTVSIISDGSHDTVESNPSFILVQPVHAEPFSPDKGNHTMHSLAQLQLVPAYQHSFRTKRTAGSEAEQTNLTKFKSQMESNNLIPAVAYRPPSPATMDASMKMISRLIELNTRNLVEKDSAINHQQKDRSMNEFTVDQRRTRFSVQSSHDSFD